MGVRLIAKVFKKTFYHEENVVNPDCSGDFIMATPWVLRTWENTLCMAPVYRYYQNPKPL